MQSKAQDSDFVKFAKIPYGNFEHQSLYLAGKGLMGGQAGYKSFPMELEPSLFCKKLFLAVGSRDSVGMFQVGLNLYGYNHVKKVTYFF